MTKARTRRIFGSDGRTVIIAMDHAAFMGPMAGLEKPADLLRTIVGSGADAILTTAGIAAQCGDALGHAGLILRSDGGSTRRDPQPAGLRQTVSVERALRLGADAVACMGMIGYADESSSLQVLSQLVDACSPWDLPVLAEMLVQRSDGGRPTADDVAFAARVGAELGADLIKTMFVPPADEYRQAIASCFVPLVVLGGEKAGDDRAVLDSVTLSLTAGATGVAIGRNVWQHRNPAGMVRALVALVHGGASVDEALEEI